MNMLDEIKADIPHAKQCVVRVQRELGALQVDESNCDCRRRKKIAFLERLEKPTEGMLSAGAAAVLDELSALGAMPERACWKAMLTAAEDDHAG